MKKLQPRVRAIKLAKEVRIRLTKELGQPVKVIMFGSQARGDATKESDIDLLVILPTIDAKTTRLASDVAWEVGFEMERVISTVVTTRAELEHGAMGANPLVLNVEREGVRP